MNDSILLSFKNIWGKIPGKPKTLKNATGGIQPNTITWQNHLSLHLGLLGHVPNVPPRDSYLGFDLAIRER